MIINILCIGDVVGSNSCEYLRKNLIEIKSKYKANIVIANGENSADGNGITPFSANHLFTSGVDIITGGNHTLKRKEIYEMLDTNPFMTRPINIKGADVGKGIVYYDLGYTTIAVLNLCGTTFMHDTDNAFVSAENALQEIKKKSIKVIIVDIHAEATSEKIALGHFLDGRVSAVFGTHTHVPTADLRILPNKTGYITDLGMCGPDNSVLGVEKEIIINRFLGDTSERFVTSKNPTVFNGCVFTIDTSSGNTISATQILL